MLQHSVQHLQPTSTQKLLYEIFSEKISAIILGPHRPVDPTLRCFAGSVVVLVTYDCFVTVTSWLETRVSAQIKRT